MKMCRAKRLRNKEKLDSLEIEKIEVEVKTKPKINIRKKSNDQDLKCSYNHRDCIYAHKEGSDKRYCKG